MSDRQFPVKTRWGIEREPSGDSPALDDVEATLEAMERDWPDEARILRAHLDRLSERLRHAEAVFERYGVKDLADKYEACYTKLQAAEGALREIDPAKLDLLADWFDQDDANKGITSQPEVQADLRRWARAARRYFESTEENEG